MHKKIIPITEKEFSGFSWVRDPEFAPPDLDGGVTACLSQEFTPPRSGELKALLKNFLEIIIGTVNATAGVVRLISSDDQSLTIISAAGISPELQAEAENFVGLDCEVSNKAALNHVVHATDISNCESRQNCMYSTCRFQSRVVAPLESPSSPESTLGILTIFFDIPRDGASCVMNTIAAFAEVMSTTIEHTRINREESRLERLSARQEIANNIHDSLAQTLTYGRMRVSLLAESIRSGNYPMATKYTREIDDALEIGQKNIRELIADFRCELNHAGLPAALQDITNHFRDRHNIHLEYQNHLADLTLPLEYEIQVYYIVQEALNNIARHSGATHARLFVDARFGYYIFTIEDNGVGAKTFTPIEGHYGMMIMRERAQRIGGEIKVTSAAGLGTQVQLFFPEPTPDWRATHE
ncbi:MAG: histidine kinase [Sideroxydans sp.]|nr:histidine kinase [Sideroxydans sp.]